MWFSIPIEVSRRMGCRQDSSRLSRLFGSSTKACVLIEVPSASPLFRKPCVLE
ncbi:hypothetical protein GLYMA_20G164801v4 [Glycine max]|nr:hypothetical protein GLYMA_20G164801v4 [Glycine max]KAH1036448.1 hypothetical protein GYH30_056078 [Glycine max]